MSRWNPLETTRLWRTHGRRRAATAAAFVVVAALVAVASVPALRDRAARTTARHVIIGTNDGAGWGRRAAQSIRRHHIVWARVEIGAYSGVRQALADGFHVLAIAGNLPDGKPLAAVDPHAWASDVAAQLRRSRGISLAEAGNEMYLKGGVANPAQYGHMYLAAVEAEHAAGLHMPLLFSTTGDYPQGSWAAPSGWSEDRAGGGWLREAVRTTPGLAAAILENGLAVHPYGAPGESRHDDWGTGAAAALEQAAQRALGAVPPLYVTEVGYSLSACGSNLGACTMLEQATRLRAAYAQLLADPHVAGIFWYQSHDDPTGRWGFMNADSSPRPALAALAQIATAEGQ